VRRVRVPTLDRGIGLAVVLFAVVAPFLVPHFWTANLLTQALILGIVASSLIFLSAYGGMVSLAQVSIYGIAGFVVGNLTTNGNTKGLNLGWNPWWGVVVAVAIATTVALIFGALSSRSSGIYFLMITLTFAVITNYFFGQVTDLSGFGGISGIPAPKAIGSPDAHAWRLYYVCLAAALVLYALLRYVVRTPFGLSLQGVRDDPVRMSSLGYNVRLHRTIAFGFAGFVAALGGVLFAWWNQHIDPASIQLSAVIDVLVIAVVGGLYRLEAAWLGAFVWVLLNNYVQQASFWSLSTRFQTVIGLVFLIVVLLSPGGLIGIWERVVALADPRRGRSASSAQSAQDGGTVEPSV
jgi:branched-chain amino acid transport system permease protein